MPEDLGKWGFLVLIILIIGPLLFWIIALLINWGKWAFFEKKKPKNKFTEMKDIKNPVSKTITIEFDLGMKSNTKLHLLNDNFESIKTLINEEMLKGHHEIESDTTELINGEYYFQLVTNNQRITKKIVVAN